MTKAYLFKVNLEWEEPVWRTIEMREDQTLRDLHSAIQEAFAWDNDHLYSFFMSGKAWDKKTQYWDDPLGGYTEGKGPRAHQAILCDLNLVPGRQFLYLFDYGDEWRHKVELLEVRDADMSHLYPKIVERHGDAPDQYGWGDDAPEISPKEALKALGSIAGLVPAIKEAIRSSENNLSKEDLEKHCALAMKLYEAMQKRDASRSSIQHSLRKRLIDSAKRLFNKVKKNDELDETPTSAEDWDTFDLLDISIGEFELMEWLVPLPLELAGKGLPREGATLALAWSEIEEAENFLGDRAVILAEAGFGDEAREQIDENLKRFPDDVWVQIKMGDAYRELKDLSAAENQYRKSLKMAESNYDRDGVFGETYSFFEGSRQVG